MPRSPLSPDCDLLHDRQSSCMSGYPHRFQESFNGPLTQMMTETKYGERELEKEELSPLEGRKDEDKDAGESPGKNKSSRS